MDFDHLFDTIATLVLHHSPSGMETEIDRLLLERFQELGLETWQDQAGNVIGKIRGRDSTQKIAITGHKDEIGAIIKAINPDGTLQIRQLGGAFPWIYGEGVVDIIGDQETRSGILSFGSRHRKFWVGNPAVLGWLYVRIKKTVSKTKWADSTLKTRLRGFRSEKLVRVKSRAQQVQEAFSQNRTVGHTESGF